MKRPLALALIMFVLYALPLGWGGVYADELEYRSKGGAYLGKFKFREIDPADALLEIQGGYPAATNIAAGYINNQIYMENHTFGDGILRFEKVQYPLFWYENNFDVSIALDSYFPEANGFQNREGEKLARRLIAIYGVRGQNVCAGLFYAGNDSDSQNEPGLFNDWYASSVVCGQGGSKKTILGIAAARLAATYRQGRKLVNLSSFDLPAGAVAASELQGNTAKIQGPAQSYATGTVIPVAFKWTGLTDLGVGSLTFSSTGNDGELSAELGDDIGRCSGKWERKGGAPGTIENSYGVWYMSCGNGLSSSGSYKMTGPSKGAGEGRDSQGRSVAFRFGQ